MIINIEDHSIIPNLKVIEIIDKRGLIATVIPKQNEITIVSKYIKDVITDMKYPQKVTIEL